jgi:hypothetical protein
MLQLTCIYTRFITVLVFGLLTTLSLRAQSLDKKSFAPLQQGSNSGSVDSMIGPHYWYLYVEPGSFQVVFHQGGAQGFAASGHASIDCGFSPPTPGSHMSYKVEPNGVVFSGTVTRRTQLGIVVTPPNSTLIRSTVPYTIIASGSAVFDSPKTTVAAIVGMYNSFLGYHSGEQPLGATRFNADGTIEAANGMTGNWKLFDQQSATYIVMIAGQRVSLHLDPGRGLIDANGQVDFARAHN